MRTVIRSIIVSATALVIMATLLTPAGAQTKSTAKHATACSMGAMHMAATGAVPAWVSAIKLPVTFTCKHCGIKMTIKTEADWLKPCPACPCGTAAWQCYPTKGK